MSEVSVEPEPEHIEPVEVVSTIDSKHTYCHHLCYDHWKYKIADSVVEANELLDELFTNDDVLSHYKELNVTHLFIQLCKDIKDKVLECETLEDLKKVIIEHHS